MTNVSPHERIIFPLDAASKKEAVEYVELLKDHVGVFKIGLELFVISGPKIVEEVKKTAPSAKIFLDLKFHDIPETVRRATKAARLLGVDFITVHCGEGKGLLKSVKEEAGTMKVLGVTVLTSIFSQEDLIEIDPKYRQVENLVLHRAELAKLSGLDGVVCSALEVKRVKERFGKDFLVVTPGIRFSDAKKDDQQRTATPYEAIKNGADYIVIGRPIRDSKNPVETVKLIVNEIERGSRDSLI